MEDNIKIGDVLKVISLGSPQSFIGDIVIFIETNEPGLRNNGYLYKVKSIKTKRIYNMFDYRFKKIGESNPNSNIIVI